MFLYKLNVCVQISQLVPEAAMQTQTPILPDFPTLTADEGFFRGFVVMTSVFLLIKSCLNGGLSYLHPCSVEVVGDVIGCSLGSFHHSSHICLSSVIVLYFSQFILCMPVSTPVVCFSKDFVVLIMPNVCVMSLIVFLLYLRLRFALQPYKLSGFHVNLFFLTTNPVVTGKMQCFDQ